MMNNEKFITINKLLIKRNRHFVLLSENAIMPRRSTLNSAGYDFYVPLNHEDIIINPGEVKAFDTDVAAKMESDDFLLIAVRSSTGIKKHLMLENQMGIIDADYYDNPVNKGNIRIVLRNMGLAPVVLSSGNKVAQGIFLKYNIADNDVPESIMRSGGIGSTDK